MVPRKTKIKRRVDLQSELAVRFGKDLKSDSKTRHQGHE